MNYIDDLLTELMSRLPELAWKLGKLNSPISTFNLPQGLFRSHAELGVTAFIDEIKSDIQLLAEQKNDRAAMFLAERIQQKINVLVRVCQLQSKLIHAEEKIHFGIKMLSTRQQWVHALESEIIDLTKQFEAVEKRLKQEKINTKTRLLLHAELGEIEKRLTLAKEELKKVTS